MASCGLPATRNIDGRPVWEPPILNYSDLIDKEYEKLREEVLKYSGDDVVRTTEILDARTELEALWMYRDWIIHNIVDPWDCGDEKRYTFFGDLWREAIAGALDAKEELQYLGVEILRDNKDKWVVEDPWQPDESIFYDYCIEGSLIFLTPEPHQLEITLAIRLLFLPTTTPSEDLQQAFCSEDDVD